MHWFTETTGWLTSPVCSTPGCSACSSIIYISSLSPIQIRFRTYHLGVGDYIDIHDGASADDRLIGRYTAGGKPDHAVQSTGRWMYVTFHCMSTMTQTVVFNLTFQEKGTCLLDQFPCLPEENDCYDSLDRCNGFWDCPLYGKDEFNCHNCPLQYFCGPGTTRCYNGHQRCNGIEDCVRFMDELHCSAEKCGHHNGTFLCSNGQCVRENSVCDGMFDCVDGTDELNCPLSSKVILSAVVGSLSCGLLLAVALGIAHRFYVLRVASNHRTSSRHISPITAIEEHIYAQRSAPPPYPEAMATSRPYEEYRREVASRTCPNVGTAAVPTSVISDDGQLAMTTPVIATSNCDDDLFNIAGSDNVLDGGGEGEGVGVVAFGCLARWHRRPKPATTDLTSIVNDPTSNIGTYGNMVAVAADLHGAHQCCHGDAVLTAHSGDVIDDSDLVMTDIDIDDRSLLIC
jgi:hypothetical protein